MNTATPFPWSELSPEENTGTTFRAVFEHSPLAVARCNPRGEITEMNPAFERSLGRGVASRRSLLLCELVRPQDREKTESLLRDLLASKCDRIRIEARASDLGQATAKWIAWRQPGREGESDHALLMAEPFVAPIPGDELLQAQRWEAVGRLAGGVAHDFNNLLTGIMLYCDLLLSSLDGRDRRRRYADEIRSAVMQATGLVRQLLVFSRPRTADARILCLNDVAVAMRDLLTRLIGEHITLNLNLDSELGVITIDRAQAEQVLLNLVLNARDALPNGGRITVETSNCRFQPVAGTTASNSLPPFPCILLVVSDDGHGMNAETRQRLFEPFFTTKNSGKGTGLGLTTVQSIVTTNRGLIHFESEPGRGTRAMILLPRVDQPTNTGLIGTIHQVSALPSTSPSQPQQKESLL